MKTFRRILVKQVNWLGDLVMSQPALRAVRKAYPQAHLSVLIKNELASFYDGSQWIDEIIPYRLRAGASGWADRLNLIGALRQKAFDLAILFPDSFEAALWPALAGVPTRVGYRRDARSWLLTEAVARCASDLAGHQVHYRLNLLAKGLGIAGDASDITIDVAAHHRETVQTWLATRGASGGALIALAAGAAYGPAKQWPASHFAELIDDLSREGVQCVLVGAPAERGKCEEVARLTTQAPPIIAAGETNIGQLIALLSLCDAFAGNDSGAMHVAAALGIPTIGIFGSTQPLRTAPLGARSEVIHLGIECSPCLQRTCRFGHYRCLTEISPAAVGTRVRAALAAGADLPR